MNEYPEMIHVALVPESFPTEEDRDRFFDARVADWNAHSLPIFQELVDEGEILYAGLNIHAYGDEWNVVSTLTAESIEKLIAIGPEFRRAAYRCFEPVYTGGRSAASRP